MACPIPEKPTGPLCEPLAMVGSGGPPAGKTLADCDVGLYCLQVGSLQFSCEPCPERESIRHEFRDRDFVAEQARDPFQSFVIGQGDIGPDSGSPKPEPHQSCKKQDQFVALNYSYQDLKLVGIVAQGTQRKVLMMDSGNLGHIIKQGDCVGKEKAVVKDIGTGYVTFVARTRSRRTTAPRRPSGRSSCIRRRSRLWRTPDEGAADPPTTPPYAGRGAAEPGAAAAARDGAAEEALIENL